MNDINNLTKTYNLQAYKQNFNLALNDVNKMDGVNDAVISAANEDLTNAYSFIKDHSQYVKFVDNDKNIYTRKNAMPKSKEMKSATKVWKDFFTTDKYDGYGFVWWMFIALLVDLAGFIFFNIAFGRDHNNSI